MKMSYFWIFITLLIIYNLIMDITSNDVLWIVINLISLPLSVLFYFDALKRERREAEAKKQFINIVINHMGNEDADTTAKRVADMHRRTAGLQ